MRVHPRSVRGIAADIEHAHLAFRRSVFAVWALALVVGGESAAWLTWFLHTPERAVAVIAASGLAAALAFGAFRGWYPAAGLIAVLGSGAAVMLVGAGAHPFYWVFALGYVGAGSAACWWGHRLRTFYLELLRAWTPRAARAGDVYTVRDGSEFAVVKVLAVTPPHVHVRQYSLRYPDRPWHVKSSTLLRPEAGQGPGAFAHLPLTEEVLARWEPILLRAEPVAASELLALAPWRRLHEAVHAGAALAEEGASPLLPE